MAICPYDAADCTTAATACAERCRKWSYDLVPLDFVIDGVHRAVHFVGFRDPQQYENAVLVFGLPDVVHRVWDQRAQLEIAHGLDVVVFAKYHDQLPSRFNYDDSNEPDDPAAKERR